MSQGQVFVRLVGLIDETRAHDEGVHPQLAKEGRLGAKGDRAGGVAAEGLAGPGQFGVGRILEGRNAGEQPADFQAQIREGGQGGRKTGFQGLSQRLQGHAGQWPDVDQQFAGAADAVGVIAAVNGAEVEGGMIDGEGRVAMPLAQFPLPGQQLTHDGMHADQGVGAQGRVAGMPRPPMHDDRLHHHALVQTDGFEPGGFSDDRPPTQPSLLGEQLPRARHGAFLVGRPQQHQRALEVSRLERGRGRQRQGQERLHVRAAEAVNPPVPFGGRERVAGPQFRVAGDGVGVAGQHQSAREVGGRGRAQCRDQVGFMGADRIDFHLKTQTLGPFRQAVNHPQIALIMTRIGAADRGLPDQGADHVEDGRQ